MPSGWFTIATFGLVVATVVYAAVARHVARRGAGSPSPVARFAVVAWWAGLAAATGAVAAAHVLAGFEVAALPPYVTAVHVYVFGSSLGSWGMGRTILAGTRASQRVALTWAAFALGYFVLHTYWAVAWPPTDVTVSGVHATMTFPDRHPAFAAAVALSMHVPLLAAAAALVVWSFRLSDPQRRFRVGVTGASLLWWLGASAAIPALSAAALDGAATGVTFVRLLAPFGVWVALAPPPALRRRFEWDAESGLGHAPAQRLQNHRGKGLNSRRKNQE